MAVGSMDFAYGDAYPNLTGITETGLLANPDKDDQEALAESENNADKTDITQPRKYTILIAIGLIVALVVFFGAGGK